MRTTVSLIVASILFLIVIYLSFSGFIVWLDYWTGLAVALTATGLGILYWGFKPQINRLFKEKGKIRNGKAETLLSREQKTETQSILQLDDVDITRFGINNNLLNQLYEQACGQAITKYHDAELSGLNLIVYPYVKVLARVNIYFYFTSLSAQRKCQFHFDDKNNQIQYVPPDGFIRKDYEKHIFTTLPWNKSPHWLQFLKQTYAKISPLSQAEGTFFNLYAFPFKENRIVWKLTFRDGFRGEEYGYEWTGKEIDDDNIKSV